MGTLWKSTNITVIFCSAIPNTEIEENVGQLRLDININIIASIIPPNCIRYIVKCVIIKALFWILKNLSLTLQQFQWPIELGRWKDIFNERCYWDYLPLTNSRKIWNGTKMVAIAPHHLIYTYLIYIRLLDIVKIGVGCYCFIRTKAMREAS